MNRRRLTSQRGLTLIELILTLGLMVVITSFSVPVFKSWTTGLRLQNATNQFAADTRMAQSLAQQRQRRARILLNTTGPGTFDGYMVQVASNVTAGTDCGAADYLTLKQVSLSANFKVDVNSATYDCLTFEPSGRTGWPSPRVLETSTAPLNLGDSWSRYFDGDQKPKGDGVLLSKDFRVVRWQDKAKVELIIDLGQPRSMDSACVSLVEHISFDGAYLPTSVRFDWSAVVGSTPPADSEWNGVPPVTAPYPGIQVLWPSPPPTPLPSNVMRSVCPNVVGSSAAGLKVRYIRFTLDVPPKPGSPGSYRILAIDEIKLSPPSIVFQNAAGKRKLSITPITGSIQLN